MLIKARIGIKSDGTIVLLKGRDTAGLVKKTVVDKNGKRQTVWVKPGEKGGKQKTGNPSPGQGGAKKDVDLAKQEKSKTRREALKNAMKNMISTLREVFSGHGGSEDAVETVHEGGQDTTRVGDAKNKEKKAKEREKKEREKAREEAKKKRNFKNGRLFD